MKNLLICAVVFSVCISATAQTVQTLLTNYENHHNRSKENSYAQLNKNVFLAGEQLWFKIYLTDPQTGLLAFDANKVYSDLYAPDGSLCIRKIWYVQDGCAFGQINLSDTLIGGLYTFKAYTNWQQNFEPERMFSTTVEIKSFHTYTPSTHLDRIPSWDIQFFPEGGDLIAGTTARIAVKGLDPNGKGQSFQGAVVSALSDTLLFFETNHLGMGSFLLPPEYSGQTGLSAHIFFQNGMNNSIPLPQPKTLGVSLQLTTFGKEFLDIYLHTNISSLKAFDRQPFYCMVHQNGVVSEMFTISALKMPLTKLQLSKTFIPAGVNTVTLFDASFNPIAERLFFAQKEEALGNVEITAYSIGDTTEVRLITTDKTGNLVPGLLSASVLPSQTKAGDFSANIYTQFLLTSETRGEVESPIYYFQENSLERLLALDNLLMTQAWRQYEWNTIINERGGAQGTLLFPFEYGFTLYGKAMRQTIVGDVASSKSEVVLNMSSEPFTRSAEITSDGSFSFDSLLIYKPFNNLFVIVTDLKGGVSNRFLRDVVILTPHLNNRIHPIPPVSQNGEDDLKSERDDENWLRFLDPDATLLSAAVVRATRARDVMISDPFVSNLDKFHEITEDDMGSYRTVMDVLQYLFGYQFSRDSTNSLRVRGKRRITTMDTAMNSTDEFDLYPAPQLIIDGIPLRDWDIIEYYTVDQIEAISEHPAGNVLLGSSGMFGSVSIKTRFKPLKSNVNNPSNFAQLTAEGFDAPIAYYTPFYSNITNKTNLSDYTCLHWAPYLTSPKGECIFRFPKSTTTQNIRIRVEGIAENGMLFSQDSQITVSASKQ